MDEGATETTTIAHVRNVFVFTVLSGKGSSNLYESEISFPFAFPSSEWSEGVTANGKKYYRNHVTKTTTWDRPTTQPDTVNEAVPALDGLYEHVRFEIQDLLQCIYHRLSFCCVFLETVQYMK